MDNGMDVISALKPLIAGEILIAENASYKEQVEKVWNKLIWNCRPLAFVVVANKKDVVQTVRFCRKNKLDVCVYGLGNTNFVLADNALVIVLTKMTSVTVDVENKVVMVEGGARLSDVDQATVKHGLVTPLGSYSALGVAGHVLLGGTGFLTRCYGTAADNVIEYELVTADGEFVTASADENSDLFWGLGGMGSNFGIVTMLKMQLHDIPNEILGGLLRYPLSQAAHVFKATRDLQREKRDKRFCIYMMAHMYTDGFQIISRFYFCGPPDEGQSILRELCERTTPTDNTVTLKPHDAFQREMDEFVRPGRFYYAALGNFVPELTDDIVDNLIDSLKSAPDSRVAEGTTMYVPPLGGRLQEIPCESSPWPFRKAEYWVGIVGAVNDQANYQTLVKWVQDLDQKNSATRILIDAPGSEEREKKLKQLKIKYDPDNFFHHNVNIDPKN